MLFITLVSMVFFIGTISAVEAYTINIRNDTPWPIDEIDGYLALTPGVMWGAYSIRPGQTITRKFTGIAVGFCFDKIRIINRITAKNGEAVIIDQYFNITHCGNLGVVIKWAGSGFSIEKYPY